MKNFMLIGASGCTAQHHIKAIKETGNNIVAAIDPRDNKGILESEFPEANFFTNFEKFEQYTDKLRQQDINIDYVSICSPSFLHDSYIRFGLQNNFDVICEKPVVLNP